MSQDYLLQTYSLFVDGQSFVRQQRQTAGPFNEMRIPEIATRGDFGALFRN